MSFLPAIATSGEVREMQARLGAAAKGTDDAVRTCAGIDEGTRAAWGLFYIQVVDFVSHGANLISWEQPDHGQALQQELYQWQIKLSHICALTTPLFDPTPPADMTLATIRYAAVAVGVVAAAYAISELVMFIPRPIARGSARG
jgi:hypothetical protein